MVDELTRENIENEIQKDLAEIGRDPKKPKATPRAPLIMKKTILDQKKPVIAKPLPAESKPAKESPKMEKLDKPIKNAKKKIAKQPVKRVSNAPPAKSMTNSPKKTAAPEGTSSPAAKPHLTAAIPPLSQSHTVPSAEHPVPLAPTPPHSPSGAADDVARSRRLFFGGIAIVVLLFIGLFYAGKYLYPSTNVVTYNGFEFQKDAIHWNFQWQKGANTYNLALRFNPAQVEDFPIEGVLDSKFNELTPIYITFDPTQEDSNFSVLSLAAGELSFNLVQALNKNLEAVCAVDDGGEACANRKIINCENSPDKAVIFLRTAKPSGIFIQGTCMTIQGENMDLLKGVDRLLYQWYGIIHP